MSTPTVDTMASDQLNTHLAQVEDRLVHDYAGVSAAKVHDLVEHERSRFGGARIHAYLPILVERAVRTALATI